MLITLKKRLKNQRGLTLVELLAVIVILGIISAIAVPSIGGIIQKSRVDAVKAEAIQVLNAGKLYLTANEDDKQIDSGEIADYLDGVDMTVTSINVSTGGSLTLNGSGSAGDVTITFENATFDQVNNSELYKTVTNDNIFIGTKTENDDEDKENEQ
jgi:type IV pilus assembly protein PilA